MKKSIIAFALLSVSHWVIADDIKTLQAQAQQGSSDAQFSLATKYATGEGVDKDPVKAQQLFEQSVSATEKDPEAGRMTKNYVMYSLAMRYLYGDGIAQNYQKALEWFTKAANNGDLHSQSNLGLMYHKGQGVSRDDKTAIEWLQKPCDKKDTYSCDLIEKIKKNEQ